MSSYVKTDVINQYIADEIYKVSKFYSQAGIPNSNVNLGDLWVDTSENYALKVCISTQPIMFREI